MFGRVGPPLLALLTLTQVSCGVAEKLAAGGRAPEACTGPTTITESVTISGKTDGASCKAPDGAVSRLYNFTTTQATTAVEVSVAPTGFQPWLGIFTSAGLKLAEMNETPWRFRLFLPAGSYQFAVSAVGTQDGSFTLVTKPGVGVEGCLAGPGGMSRVADAAITMKGVSIPGVLTASDCGAPSGLRVDGFIILGAAGTPVTITLSADRAAAIYLYEPSSGGGVTTLASRTLNAAGTVTFTAPASANRELSLSMTGFPGTGTIGYTITIN